MPSGFKNRGKDLGTGFKNRGPVFVGNKFKNRGAVASFDNPFKNRGQAWFDGSFTNRGPTGLPTGGRWNILTSSEDLTGNYWVASPAGSVTATANDAVAPDGTTTAEKIVTNDLLENGHGWFETFTGSVNTTYCFSLYMKAGDYTRAAITLENTGFADKTGALFDLSNGTVVSDLNDSNPIIESVGNGWYRCSVSATSDADGGTYAIGIYVRESDATVVSDNYIPASTGLGHYVFGAQVEIGTTPSEYQKITL
jgi:hypothetical protein